MKEKSLSHPFVHLTDRAFEILKKMNEGEELYVSDGEVWLENKRTNFQIIHQFLNYCLVRCSYCYWTINQSGRKLIAGKKKIYTIVGKDGKLVDSDHF